MRGWGDGGLRFWDAKTRHIADEGQESFSWPRTRDRGEPQSNGLTGGVESWDVQVPKEFCDRPCADSSDARAERAAGRATAQRPEWAGTAC